MCTANQKKRWKIAVLNAGHIGSVLTFETVRVCDWGGVWNQEWCCFLLCWNKTHTHVDEQIWPQENRVCLTAHYLPESHIDHGVFTRLIALSLRADWPVRGERRGVCVYVCLWAWGRSVMHHDVCVLWMYCISTLHWSVFLYEKINIFTCMSSAYTCT